MLPSLLTLLIIPQISNYMLYNILVYKKFIEIAGHTGKYSYPTCSFCKKFLIFLQKE